MKWIRDRVSTLGSAWREHRQPTGKTPPSVVNAGGMVSWGIGVEFAPELRRTKQRTAEIPLELRIGEAAERLRGEGYSAISALAAAEAVETGRELGLRFDRLELDEEALQWWAHYESGPLHRPALIALPLVHASEAHQRGVGSLN